MDKAYWEHYYKEHAVPAAPSLFAEFVSTEYLEPGMRLIELGCGNGRDSVFFARKGVSVRAVDQVDEEIAFLNNSYAHEKLEFAIENFTKLKTDNIFDCVYSRFTLHSVPVEEELRVLEWANASLVEGGVFCVEVRSINDPKLQEGDRVSDCENIVDGHYRRYLDLHAFKERLLGLGFAVLFSEERTGFAPYGSEDPPVIRVVAKKVGS